MIYQTDIYRDQFGFQREHAHGAVVNVGSNTDGAHLKRDFGAVNVDVREVDHVTGEKLPVDVIADARDLPYEAEFDTVVLGEILEHMEPADAVRTLRSARRALRAGGMVVITMPHDGRRDAGTLPTPEGKKQFYAPGVYAYHYRSISLAELYGWIAEAGLEPVLRARIQYVWGERGTGMVCRMAEGVSC